jgi:hypothetical protein
MASAVYLVGVDFDRDETFGHANGNITPYVLDMNWNNGMTRPDQEVANPATLSLTLDNSQGDFNLEEGGATFNGLFKRGQLIRVRATFNATGYDLFYGKLETIPSLDPKNYGSMQVRITATDLMAQLMDAEFTPDLLTEVTTDSALQHVFDKALVALPYTSHYWVLGHSTNSILGSTTRLVDALSYVSFETGKTTLAYVGDNTGGERSTRAQTFIRDVVQAEAGGRFWFDGRTNKFVFHNRHHDINPTIAVTIDGDDYEDGKYIAQTEVINRVTVHFTPREIGAANAILWQSEGVITLGGHERKTITARYRDPDENSARVGGQDFSNPLRGADFIANTESDGSGTDVSDDMTFSVEFGAAQAKITLENPSSGDRHITTLQVRGTPIKSYNKQSVTRQDGDSFVTYDIKDDTITLNAVDALALANRVAGRKIRHYKDPLSLYESITFKANNTDTRMKQALTRTIGDAITVQHSGIGHDKDYVIVGERHRVTGGGDFPHEVTWILYPNTRQRYWVLGDSVLSVLGDTTILAF